MIRDIVILAAGLACAGVGGELFLRGTVGFARRWRISPAIAGVTLAAFATSSPELVVGIMSGINRQPRLSLGDVLGSNVVNIALVLALFLVIRPMERAAVERRRDVIAALTVPVSIAILAGDGRLSRLDGALLLVMFAGWLGSVLLEVRRQRQEKPSEEVHKKKFAALFFGSGLLFLLLAGRLIVVGAQGLAEAWGIGSYAIGAVLVALGTSVPELATAIIAAVKKHDDIGLGNILGSNIFNGWLIVGVVALISPYALSFAAVWPALLAGVITTVAIIPLARGRLGRGRGLFLLILYLAFVLFTVSSAGGPK